MRKFAFTLMLAVIAATMLVVLTTGTVSADAWPPCC